MVCGGLSTICLASPDARKCLIRGSEVRKLTSFRHRRKKWLFVVVVVVIVCELVAGCAVRFEAVADMEGVEVRGDLCVLDRGCSDGKTP